MELAERLNDLTPGDHAKRTMFANSGAEAVENAVKIARYTTGRPAVVAFDHAFHGRTLLAMSLTAKVMPYKQGFGPFAPEVYRLPFAYPYRWPAPTEECRGRCADHATDEMHKHIGEENIAAVILEPIQGEGGFIVPSAGFLKGVAEFCAAHGIVFIADEIQSGMGRAGRWFGDRGRGRRTRRRDDGEVARRGHPDQRRHRARRDHGRRPRRRTGGTYGGNPWRLRPRWPCSRRSSERTC